MDLMIISEKSAASIFSRQKNWPMETQNSCQDEKNISARSNSIDEVTVKVSKQRSSKSRY